MEHSNDPICGGCGKPRSKHFHEDDDYCFEKTQDTFTEHPSESTLLAWMRRIEPRAVDRATASWRLSHGHE